MPKVPDFDALIEHGRSGTMTATDVAESAVAMAESGDCFSWSEGAPVADLASTGGPGSLSTLLAPLELRRLGCRVVKLGVPGRPAGGVDALGTVPGYSVHLTEREVRDVVQSCGYAHFLANERFAPMDAALFAYRKATGAVAVPALAAASLLSKKLAVGVKIVGLDVRVGPHGNFGATMIEARANAQLFCEAARLVGLVAIAFLYSRSGAEQPWIGRGEALAALDDVLQGAAAGDLSSHAERCFRMAALVAEEADIATTSGVEDLSTSLVAVAESNLAAQGSTLAAFLGRARSARDAPRQVLHASLDGVVNIDMAALRAAIVDGQRTEDHELNQLGFSDGAGVVLLRAAGDSVRRGDSLAAVRHTAPKRSEELATRLATAVTVGPSHHDAVPLKSMEVVRA